MSAIGTGGSVKNAIDTGGNVYAEDWSQYPAVQNVNMAGYTIVNTTIDVSDQNINVRDISAKDISANNVYVNSTLDTNGSLYVAQDISCGGTIRTAGLQVIDNAMFDPWGTGLYGFQRGIAYGGTYNNPGTSNYQKWNNQVGIFGNSLSGYDIWADAAATAGSAQSMTNLQIFDTWLSGHSQSNAAGIGFGCRNYGFGKYNVIMGKIGGQTQGNFLGGLVAYSHSNGKLRTGWHLDYARRMYNHGLTTLSGGVNTPINVYSNATGTTSHGSHLNLHGASFALGTQSEGTYIRSYQDFNVQYRGTHATSGAGAGGFTMMTLDLSGPSFASNAYIGGGTVLRERNQPITDVSDVTVDLKDQTSEAAFTRSCIQLSGGHLNVRMATSDLCAGADWDTVEFYVGNAGAAPRNVNFNCYSNDSQVSADGRILDFWNPPGVNTGFISYGSSVSGPEVAANEQAIIKVKKCKANTFGANSLGTQFMVTSV